MSLPPFSYEVYLGIVLGEDRWVAEKSIWEVIRRYVPVVCPIGIHDAKVIFPFTLDRTDKID